jgi:5'-methylthioadenosine phosphorylase
VAMVTDFDCWHPEHDDVTVEAVVRILLANAGNARDLVRKVVPELGQKRGPCPCGCDTALTDAIITAADRRDPALLLKLAAIADRLL